MIHVCHILGNSSQLTDGAGAVLLMKRSIALQKGLPILGVFRSYKSLNSYNCSKLEPFMMHVLIHGCTCRSFAAVGVDPFVMGIGPAVAIPAAIKSANLELDDIDLFEINEVNLNYIH